MVLFKSDCNHCLSLNLPSLPKWNKTVNEWTTFLVQTFVKNYERLKYYSDVDMNIPFNYGNCC